MAELGWRTEEESGKQPVTPFQLEMSHHSQEWEWAPVQQRAGDREECKWARERGAEAQWGKALLTRLTDKQDQGGGNCKYPYSIHGNENKGENSLWFDTPTGQAVFFSPHLLS